MTPSRQPSSLEHAVLLLGDADEPLVRDEHDHEVGRRLELRASTTSARACRGGRAPGARDRRDSGCATSRPPPRRRRGTRRAGPWRRRRPACRRGSARRGRAAAARPRCRGRRLLLEVAVGEHAGRLDDVPELDLAPAAAYVRRAQRLDEVAGLEPEALLRAGKRVQMLGDGAVRLLARPSPSRSSGGPSARASPSTARHARQLGLRDLQKRRARLPERLGGQRLEGVPRLGDDRARSSPARRSSVSSVSS